MIAADADWQTWLLGIVGGLAVLTAGGVTGTLFLLGRQMAKQGTSIDGLAKSHTDLKDTVSREIQHVGEVFSIQVKNLGEKMDRIGPLETRVSSVERDVVDIRATLRGHSHEA